MYTAAIIVLLAIASRLLFLGINKNQKGKIWGGSLIGIITLLFFGLMSFWGEMLWFESTGHIARFWKEFAAQGISIGIGAIAGGLITYALTYSVPKNQRPIQLVAIIIAVIYGISWGHSNWDTFLKYFNQVQAGIQEPFFQKDAGFYMFSLPFYNAIFEYLVFILIISIGAVFIASQNRPQGNIYGVSPEVDKEEMAPSRALLVSGFIFIVVLAAGKYLSRMELLFSNWGVVNGPGRTDEVLRIPAYTISIILTALLGMLYIAPFFRKKMFSLLTRFKVRSRDIIPYYLGGVIGIMLIVWFILLSIAPGLFQMLRVEPNEISMEKPYIENNIEFTRYGFDIQDVKVKEYPVTDTFNQRTITENQSVFDNIRLWDWRALKEVYEQFQEIRLYYEFTDVDIDRYNINGEPQQIMISAREIDQNNLPAKSKNFINKRFKYTHGYGVTLTKVNEFTSNGLPNLLIKDIPPKSTVPELEVTQPEIYYGEVRNQHVIVNTKEKEFDYPSGEKNKYTQYQGEGGVQISNFWRKLLYGWKFDGTKLLLSSYITDQSRIMFTRQIEERVNKITPFLEFDRDPYIVLADGELYWIIDAYTTTNRFPYSEPFISDETIDYKQGAIKRGLKSNVAPYLNGSNYIRNSVKIIVNAHNGNMNYYTYEKDDPIIQVWDNIFPGLFKPKEQMPKKLKDHIRYPVDKLAVQGQVYAKYHMTDPEVFYNQEDLWIRATEKYYNQIQPVDPYYVMWERPGSNTPEFTLIQPYTPKNRQVLIGWIAGLSNSGNYGDFIAYKFPKDKRILGPQQVETKIDQDSYLSEQLSLWDQRGSNVIRGNVLAIPVGNTLLYVEPIYLQSETASYPELRLVALMHGDKLSYAPSFDKALQQLLTKSEKQKDTKQLRTQKSSLPASTTTTSTTQKKLIREAHQAFNNYMKQMGKQDFEKASKSLDQLKQKLQTLQEETQGTNKSLKTYKEQQSN